MNLIQGERYQECRHTRSAVIQQRIGYRSENAAAQL